MPPGKTAAASEVEHALLIGACGKPNPDRWIVCFAGQLHNRQALSVDLGHPDADPAMLYAAALERWGDRTDEHCIGHYAAIALAPGATYLRLARSPFVAPPLHFRHDGVAAVATQQPGLLFWREPDRPLPDLDRLAETLVNDASDRYRSWYRGARRVPLGTAVNLRPLGWTEAWHYDLFSRPQLRLPSTAAYIEMARKLLDDGVAAALDGASKPAIMLSGGLDSPLVAASALRQLPSGKALHGYTFGPDPAWSGEAPEGVFTSDFDRVEAFARLHPGLITHFETNPGRHFLSGQRELLAASDGAPSMLGPAWIEGALHEAARKQGCDVMLCGTWGNFGFSSRGPWAFSEYLVSGRWRQLGMAIRGRIGDPRPAWRQVAGLAIAPLLPRPLWQAGRHLFGTGSDPLGVTAIRRDWPGLKQTLRRSRHAGYDVERLQFASKRAHWRALLAEDGQEQDQYVLGMELIHGLGRRDPTAYRPLVEFCWGCPTALFLRDGTDRWLAREMARGIMPEAQRLDRAYGHQFADWQPRFAPIRGELMDELGRMADDPEIAALIDLPRLMRLVEAIPDEPGDYDPQAALPYQIALPIGMAAARFIAYAKGRNDI